MPKRKLSTYSNFALPFQQSDLDSDNVPKECLTKFQHITRQDVVFTLIEDFTSILFGIAFLLDVSQRDNFLRLGKLESLYIPVLHSLFELFKLQLYMRSERLRFQYPSCREFFCAYLIGTVICHCAVVLFGAGVISDIEETFVFSCILTGFVLVPTYYLFGRDTFYLLTCQKIAFSPLFTSFQSIAYASVAGAWFGAFVIPLDWERKWQKWPIPCVIGSVVGYILGHAYSMVFLTIRFFL